MRRLLRTCFYPTVTQMFAGCYKATRYVLVPDPRRRMTERGPIKILRAVFRNGICSPGLLFKIQQFERRQNCLPISMLTKELKTNMSTLHVYLSDVVGF